MTTQTWYTDTLNYSKNHGELIYLHTAIILCVNFMQLKACAIILVYIDVDVILLLNGWYM